MSTQRPTPETEAVAAHEGSWDTKALRMTTHARKLERERDEMAARIDELEGRSVHSCGDHCQRPACVKRREREKLIAEKDAQIAALREALQGTNDCAIATRRALAYPPPAVVPLEDVRPLVEAIKQCTQFTIHPSMSEQNLISATKQFIAKHPL